MSGVFQRRGRNTSFSSRSGRPGRITRGEASEDDLAQLERLAGIVQKMSLCGLGQGAPNPIFSTLRYFKDEYMAHILDRTCPAGVCTITQPAEVVA